jgi:hypothetical protein
MPLRWKIAPLEHMVVCVAEGAVTMKDLMEYFAALEAAGASDYRKILDATHAENAFSDADRVQLAAYAKAYGRRGAPGPMAVVTGAAGNDTVVADIKLMLRPDRRMREFPTIHEARAWLDRVAQTQKNAAPSPGRRRAS